MKPSFLNSDKPFLMSMIQEETMLAAMHTITNSLYEGADSFGIQLENLLPEHRTPDALRNIFAACQKRPIYITAGPAWNCKDESDDALAELLLRGAECGATLCDIRSDSFCPDPNQITYDEVAVSKQKALADKIHALGREVVFSCHLPRFFNEEEVLAIAQAQRERGADIIKIVNRSGSEEEELANLNIIHKLKKELDCKFIYLASGSHTKLVRQMGPALGTCAYLCVQNFALPAHNLYQPKLSAARAIRDALLLS